MQSQLAIPGRPSVPDLRPFLSVNLPMRLVLLAIYDNKTMPQIKKAMPWVKETDVRLTSRRIHAAIEELQEGRANPTGWMNPGPEVDNECDLSDPETPFPLLSRLIPEDIEIQLRKTLWPDTVHILFGEHVPPEVAALSLQHRVIIYLLVVEEMERPDVIRMMKCTDHAIRESLSKMVEALEAYES